MGAKCIEDLNHALTLYVHMSLASIAVEMGVTLVALINVDAFQSQALDILAWLAPNMIAPVTKRKSPKSTECAYAKRSGRIVFRVSVLESASGPCSREN